MIKLRGRIFVSEAYPNAVSTGADSESPITHQPAQSSSEQWQHFIDHKLLEWARKPADLEDEGLDPPTIEVICRAIELATLFQREGDPPPTTVSPDPNGGIVFTRKSNGQTEEYHLWDDGVIEYCRFEGARLVERRPVDSASLTDR